MIDREHFDETPGHIGFGKGTRIRTIEGDRAIETLLIGDLIQTEEDGFQPIRQLRKRSVPANGAAAPVHFTIGAIGNEQAMTLAPDCSIQRKGWQSDLLFGKPSVLVAALDFVDERRIFRAHAEAVTYYQIILDKAAIIYAAGIAVCAQSLATSDASCNVVPFPGFFGAQGQKRDCLKSHEAQVFLALDGRE